MFYSENLWTGQWTVNLLNHFPVRSSCPKRICRWENSMIKSIPSSPYRRLGGETVARRCLNTRFSLRPWIFKPPHETPKFEARLSNLIFEDLIIVSFMRFTTICHTMVFIRVVTRAIYYPSHCTESKNRKPNFNYT